jgi:hypothetical protein
MRVILVTRQSRQEFRSRVRGDQGRAMLISLFAHALTCARPISDMRRLFSAMRARRSASYSAIAADGEGLGVG